VLMGRLPKDFEKDPHMTAMMGERGLRAWRRRALVHWCTLGRERICWWTAAR